jgi:hypothetical protein
MVTLCCDPTENLNLEWHRDGCTSKVWILAQAVDVF